MKNNIPDRIPDRAECEELMARYSMLPNIVEHSLQVMRVSLAVTDHLQDGVYVNRDLVAAAALLHDITKTRSLTTKERHAASGGVLLRELGFLRVAEIVEQHVIIQNMDLEERLQEMEIVYYADKRVMHDKIVTIDERVHDLIRRYATGEQIRDQIIRNKEQALIVERKIAGFMKISIQDALELILRRNNNSQ
ncbi:MAG: metal-dependent phosphohydrolase [Deltaproteobacteria bacterium HGW-Deltaproteobacteria-12]|jgi:putative nucleotidyltransferase with HDIG domain|nr:MAG: metal-dependent phosphohydrolase [Deltaproteobacteria bacterium HGW-Deltaproteobacteria-12]